LLPVIATQLRRSTNFARQSDQLCSLTCRQHVPTQRNGLQQGSSSRDASTPIVLCRWFWRGDQSTNMHSVHLHRTQAGSTCNLRFLRKCWLVNVSVHLYLIAARPCSRQLQLDFFGVVILLGQLRPRRPNADHCTLRCHADQRYRWYSVDACCRGRQLHRP
jgi:hypothetical protein